MPRLQIPLFPPDSSWRPPALAALPSWANARRISIDCETCDPLLKTLGPGVRRGGVLVGVGFAIEDGPCYYLPFRHENGTNLHSLDVLNYLREQARVFRGELVGANLSYDLDYLLSEGIDFRPKWFRDVQIAEPLIDELQNSYSLDAIAKRHGLPGKNEELLRFAAESYGIDPKHELYRLPPEYVGPYAERDVTLPLQLLRRQEKTIEDEGLWNIYNLESQLLPVLVKMRRRGVRVSWDRLDQVERWALAHETAALAEVHRLTGIRLVHEDVWKAEAVAAPLRKIGVEVPLTPATKKASVSKELLAEVDHPVAKFIGEARRYNKIVTTFAQSVRIHATNGRIHCTLKQLRGTGTNGDDGDDGGGRYGRLSSSDPNLQQQPARDPDIGPMWRSIYVPDDGKLWCSADYSQQEPRWLVHYAELAHCGGAREAAERYRNDPKTDNHQMMSELTGIPRKRAKDLFLGKCYGMGGAKLCHSLGLPTKWIKSRSGNMIEVAGDEGQSIIDQFDRMVPFVKQLSEICEQKAARTGFIRTVLGRRCRFPKVGEAYDWTYKALNRLIQGSSADQTKKAMVDADAAGIPIQLQVHDEIDLSVSSREEAENLANIMKGAVPAQVPFRVDVELGDSWGTAK